VYKRQVYVSALEKSAILRVDAAGQIETLIADPRIAWPDSFAQTPDGTIYFTTSLIHLGPDRDTPYGRLVIGGAGRNTYDCNRVSVIVDLGGDDEYDGAAGGADETRRFAVCIDLPGSDVYKGGTGALGSAAV